MALEPVVTHLWQSTLFALAVATATLAFRRNRAAVRHGLWLAASVKFLVPFAALVTLGNSLGLRGDSQIRTVHREIAIVMNAPDQASSLPPLFPALWSGDLAAPPSLFTDAASRLARMVPIAVPVWIIGVLAILAVWIVRWRRVAAIARAATPIDAGPHLDMLRALERRAGRTRPLAFVASDAPLEPGVFGIRRPVLVWPETIANHLGGDQIAAILAHELSHVRRRDNLAAAIHMLVEALFWFHPMVWWIGARLVDERERACDEDVLQSGSEPELYATTILQACRLYLEAPLACVSGVTGSDLTRRIEHIMTGGRAHALSAWRKALLAACAVGVVAVPIAAGAAAPKARVEVRSTERVTRRTLRPWILQASPQDAASLPKFEVASVKPSSGAMNRFGINTSPGGRLTATNAPLSMLIQFAYRLQSYQITGGPDWFTSDRFDIVAKGDDTDAGEPDQPSRMQLMLRALLAQRFKLVVRTEEREMPLYSLVLARPDRRLGQMMHPSTAGCDTQAAGAAAGKAANPAPPTDTTCGIRMGLGKITIGGATIPQVANVLSGLLERTVVDRTGLTGPFDATLSWTPDQSTPGMFLKAGYAPQAVDQNGPSIFTAVQEQLGLKLDASKGPVTVMVIVSAQRPIAN